jgi:hypothetical protein
MQAYHMLQDFVLLDQFSLPYIIHTDPMYTSITDHSFPKPDVQVTDKTIFLKGKEAVIRLNKHYGVTISGQGVLNYDSPRNNGEVRAFERADRITVSRKIQQVKDDSKEFMDAMTKPMNRFIHSAP